MSTNDTVVLMASGASGAAPEPAVFAERLHAVCADLSRQLVADAEGAAHDVLIRVVNASSEEAGEAVARAVSRSNLFKAAIFGQDPNWGRVISAVGTVPEDVARSSGYKMDQKAPIATVQELKDYDAIIIGAGTRFGRLPSQMAAFWDMACLLYTSPSPRDRG